MTRPREGKVAWVLTLYHRKNKEGMKSSSVPVGWKRARGPPLTMHRPARTHRADHQPTGQHSQDQQGRGLVHIEGCLALGKGPGHPNANAGPHQL